MHYTFQSTVLPGIITAIAAYLLGSISFSIIFTRLYAGHADIRDMGSLSLIHIYRRSTVTENP